MSQSNSKFSIFHLEGGLGKHIAATAVAKCIKNNHPDRELIIVCAYPDIFLNLPFVDRVYRIGKTPYFYKDFIDGKDSLIFKHEPYYTSEHIHKQLPLIENWCKLYNLQFSGESPALVFNLRQLQYYQSKWKRDKPVAIIQTNGGPLKEQPYLYSWTRDMPSPIAIDLIAQLSKDYHVMQICRSNVQAIHGAEAIHESIPNMELLSLLLFSEKRVLIDSCIQHAAAALNLPSTVLWVGTSPVTFGYTLHTNIIATIPDTIKLPNSYLFDYNFTGDIYECPLLDMNIFDTSEILNIN